MKKLILLPLFLFSFLAYSQTREELVQKINEHYNAGEYDKALPYARQAVEAAKKDVGENHLEYAVAANDLGLILSMVNENEEAIPWIQKAAGIRKVQLGEAHPSYLRTMLDLAILHKNIADYSTSIEIMKELVPIWKYLDGEYSQSYAAVLKEYGLTLISSGDLNQAESALLQLEKIQKRIYGEGHPEYAITCSGLGILYLQLARYDRAEAYLLHSLRFYEATGDPSDIAVSRSNLGYLYFSMSQYDRAEAEYLKSQLLKKQIGDTASHQYATLLSNMGVLYTELEDYDKALTCVQRASEIRKEIVGTEHSDYAITLQNLSGVYFYLEQYDKVEPLLKEVVRIYKKTLGEDHPEYATSISNLASFYFEKKEYKKAEPLLEESLEIRKKLYGDVHPDYAMSLRNMAMLYMGMDKNDVAEKYLLQQNESISKFLTSTFNFLPEQEREDYLQNVIVLDDNSSFLTNYKKASPAMVRSNLEQLLFLKSLSLSGAQGMLHALRKTTDPETRKLFESWLGKKKELASLLTQGEPEEDVIEELEEQTNRLEKDLMQKSSAFREEQTNSRVSIRDVQEKMGADEVVIEFIRYDLYFNDWTDSVYYGAYILHKQDSVPSFVYLFEEKQLQSLFDSAGKSAVEQAFSFYRGLIKKEENNSGVIGEQLYRLLWAPLEPYLKNKRSIAYSPAGLLYNIALHALPVDSNTLLLDRYGFRQFTSTRLVAKRDEKRINPAQSDIVLFGDPIFDAPGMKTDVTDIPVSAPGKRGGREKWDKLPGTAQEVNKISALFRNKEQASFSFTGAAASEEAFKQLNGKSPRILHVATHGFFLPTPEKKKEKNSLAGGDNFAQSENPLVRSGLVFSRANLAWTGQAVPEGEDGIATAYEISQLDLSNTELIVLSACETALGDIKGSEGVFGLQRAFKMAGVQKMIVSLWQVPDAETSELMTMFYSNWLSGQTVEDALANAQKEMRKKYSPFFWAAFVLVE